MVVDPGGAVDSPVEVDVAGVVNDTILGRLSVLIGVLLSPLWRVGRLAISCCKK